MDAINSVQLCCHTGYGSVRGQILESDDLNELYSGLKDNSLHLDYSYLLTGYVHSLSFMQSLHALVSELKGGNSGLKYICDPVMGDDGRMYVPPDLLPFYKNEMIGLADVLTPNQYEAELLTDVTITSEESAFHALDLLHEKGIPVIVLTSSNLTPGTVTVLASSVSAAGSKQQSRCEFPRIDATFTGTGDLTAALLLAWLHKTDWDLQQSLSNALSSVQAVLSRTMRLASKCPDGLTPRNLELKLVESKSDLESPPGNVFCIRLT